MKRRTFLKGTVATSALAVAATAGLLRSGQALAAADKWPAAAFGATDLAAATKAVFGSGGTVSKDIKIKAPLQAENGAVVPIKVITALPNVKSIAIFVAKNPRPLATKVDFGSDSVGFYSTRVKMGKTSDVVVYVNSGGKILKNSAMIKVTVGGCGG
ncbi:MAG: thiosulfate oxidation carrier protein SoxY [Gammaproteobacteria bacterium]|nr:thiosulfate oxidation carrier protein SoxY [Gammaproteobacteria bacterium]